MAKKVGYAKYTFAFAADVQKLADDKHIKVLSFQTSTTNQRGGKHYDVLSVRFLVARPDLDETEKPVEPEKPVEAEETPVETTEGDEEPQIAPGLAQIVEGLERDLEGLENDLDSADAQED